MSRVPGLAALVRWRSAHTRLSLWALLVLEWWLRSERAPGAA